MDHHGWWNYLVANDMDEDGDTDFVVGNFGHNSQIHAFEQEPASLLVKDFDDNGSIDPILSSYKNGQSHPIVPRDDLINQLEPLKKKFDSYEDYAKISTAVLFSPDELEDAQILKASILSSVYLENQGNGTYVLYELPLEAQVAPVYSILTDDFDLHGHKDILMGGNFTGAKVQLGRYDASKGTLLLGDGNGNFKVANNRETGLLIKGRIRDIKSAVTGDGRQLIIVARNGEAVQVLEHMKLYKTPDQ